MLFEIDLNPNFKILNRGVYLSKDTFMQLCQENIYIYGGEKLNDFINTIEQKYITKEDLYPDWLLFTSSGWFPNKYVNIFQYVAEVRHEKYIKSNYKYSSSIKFNKEIFESYLNQLLVFYQDLKRDERYKLMWNLEIYIKELIRIIIDKNNDKNKKQLLKNIYKNIGESGTYSILHEIHIFEELYVEESKNIFTNEITMKRFKKCITPNITSDEIMNTLQINEKYQDTLFSIAELHNRFNADTKNRHLLSAITKGIVLGLEEYIRDKFNKDGFDGLKQLLENNDVKVNNLTRLRNKINNQEANEVLLCKLEKIIVKEEDSLEKYLIIYYHARNYIAHNNIDMDKFFWGEDRQRTIISNVMDSIIIILYKLSITSREKIL